MESITPKKRIRRIHALYALTFVFSLSIAIPTYINSSFLAEFTTERMVGIIYTVGALLAIISFVFIPTLLRKFGNIPVTIWLILMTVIALAGLAIAPVLGIVVALFLIYQVTYRLISYDADLLLESYSEDRTTGSIRGAFLTINSTAWVLAPIIAGFVLGNDSYWRIFVLAGVLSALLIPIVVRNFKRYEDPQYDRAPFWSTLREIYRDKDIYKVFSAYMLLRFFYAWMVIYTPIYLHQHVGLPWSSIGIIFTVMLLPFVLLEYPLGKIADTRLGEKEIITLGFIVLAVASGALTFITSTAIWVWALALFATRIGASMVEIMGETYFFKKIDSADSKLLGFFRMTGPISYIIAPALASIVLSILDFRFLFLALGIFMLWGLRYSLTLHDTR